MPATKPVRIYERDHAPLGLMAVAERRPQAAVVHDALRDYMQKHRERLSAAFAEAQKAVESGSIDVLATYLETNAKERAAAHAKRVGALRAKD